MLSTREISIIHAAYELTTTLYMCLLVKKKKKIYLQKLITHHYKDRRRNSIVRFKALLGTDPPIPDEITTAAPKHS